MQGGELIKYGLLAGAAWLGWQKYQELQAVAPPPAAGTPPAGTPPPPVVITLEQRLLAAAGASATTKQGPDQWAYYYAGLTDANGVPKGSLVGTALDVWFPSGRPENQAEYPQITAAQFVAGLASKGISGYWRVIPVPTLRRVA